MQQGSSSTNTLTLTQTESTLPLERKQHLAVAINSAASMCAGISAIAQLSLNEGQVELESVEAIHHLAQELREKLLLLHGAIVVA